MLIIQNYITNLLKKSPTRLALCSIRILAFLGTPFMIWGYFLSSPFSLAFWNYIRTVFLLLLGKMEKQVWLAKTEELIQLPTMLKVEGWEHYQKARASERGLILTTIHSVHFRLLQHWVNQYDPNEKAYLIQVFPEVTDGYSYQLQLQQRKIFNGRLLNVNYNPDLRRAVSILKQGGIIIICQDVTNSKAEPVPFLNRNINIPLGAAKLAAISGALILPLNIINEGLKLSWQLKFEPLIDPNMGGTKTKLLNAIESIIMKNPESWDYWNPLPLREIRSLIRIHIKNNLLKLVPFPLSMLLIRIIAIPIAVLSKNNRKIFQIIGEAHKFCKFFYFAYLRTVSRFEEDVLLAKGVSIKRITQNIKISGMTNLENALNPNRGVIICTLNLTHLQLIKNWLCLSALGERVFLIREIPANGLFDHNLREVNRFNQDKHIFNNRIIDIEHGSKTMRKVLSRNNILLTCVDLYSGNDSAIDFLGMKMRLKLFNIGNLAAIAGSPVLPVIVFGSLNICQYTIGFYPPLNPEAGPLNQNLLNVMADAVKTHPEVWNNWKLII